MGRNVVRLLCACVAVCWFTCTVRAQTNIFTQGHFDAPSVGYSGGVFTMEIHDHDNDLDYSPANSLLVAVPESIVNRPAGSQWDFLGVSAGQPLWVLPSTQVPGILYIGAAAEDVPASTVTPWSPGDPRIPGGNFPWVRLNVVAVRGPGRFSVYTTDTFGNPIVWASRSSGGNHVPSGLPSSLFLLEGSHLHFNWAFSAEGEYEVDWQVVSAVGGQPVTSDVETFFYRAAAVPEPSALALAGLSSVGLLAAGRRWQRRRRNKRRPSAV